MLDEFEAREEIADFERGRIGRIGAVRAIVADARAEVVTNGAGSGLLGIGGTHSVAPLLDAVFSFENQGEDLAGAHEFAELAEKGASFVDGVKTCGFATGENHCFNCDNSEAGFVNAGENFALLVACDGVWLDDCESAFESQLFSPLNRFLRTVGSEVNVTAANVNKMNGTVRFSKLEFQSAVVIP